MKRLPSTKTRKYQLYCVLVQRHRTSGVGPIIQKTLYCSRPSTGSDVLLSLRWTWNGVFNLEVSVHFDKNFRVYIHF